jgi:gas vesicle protein
VKEVEMREKGEQSDLIYFLAGSLFGVLTAIFLSPGSGRDARSFFASRMREGKDAVIDRIRREQEKMMPGKEALEAEAKKLLEKVRDITRSERDVILAAIDAGRKVYREKKGSLDPKDGDHL